MKIIIILTGLILLSGCAVTKYPNWEYVRIEHTKPLEACEYRVQEACPVSDARCYDWYKKRATVFKADVVYITGTKSEEANTSNNIVVNNNIGRGDERTNLELAEYYHCNLMPQLQEKKKKKRNEYVPNASNRKR